MNHIWYLACRYLWYYRVRSLLLISALTCTFILPSGLYLLLRHAEQHLQARAFSSPIVIGAPGSSLDLVLNALYFRIKPLKPVSYLEYERLLQSRSGLVCPLYVRFRAQMDPIIGTTIDYFTFRNCKLATGRPLSILGEAVVGANVAKRRNLHVGDSILSTAEQAFDLAGSYPLKLNVVGILLSNNSPDDDAIFCDIKTAWIIQGIGHGHQDVPTATGQSHIQTKIAVPNYNEINDKNRDSFHFHGNPSDFPLTAILVAPDSERSGTILLGKYQAKDSPLQAIEPKEVIEELLSTVITIRYVALAILTLAGVVCFGLVLSIQILAIRLREREMITLDHIGCSRLKVLLILMTEFIVVISLALVFTIMTLFCLYQSSNTLLRFFIS